MRNQLKALDYLAKIKFLESIRNDRWMLLQLSYTIVGIGKETEFEELKEPLRELFKEVKKMPNPFSLSDGSVVNKKAHERLLQIIIEIIDLLNDYYGNYKTL